MKIKAILTGATGMVGEGVLLTCLDHPAIEEILMINRRPLGISHPKLKELIHTDFFDLSTIEEQLTGYNTCFFCLGVSSVGMDKETYQRLTYHLTINFGKLLAQHNPELTFCYVSGGGTDSSEKGSMAWARVKGATENELKRLFKNAYLFRPGFLKAVPGQKKVLHYYKYVNWLYPIGRAIYPAGFCTLQELGLAMIRVSTKGYPKQVMEVKDIVAAAKETH